MASKTVHRAKLHVCDSGLAAGIIGKNSEALQRRNDPSLGPLLESFVIAELAKQLTWSEISGRLHHYRDANGLEIDAIVEAPDGRILAIEIKSSTVPRSDDAAPMAHFRDRLDRVGQDFVMGFIKLATGRLGQYQNPLTLTGLDRYDLLRAALPKSRQSKPPHWDHQVGSIPKIARTRGRSRRN